MCSGVSEFVVRYVGLMACVTARVTIHEADNVNGGTITQFTRGGNKKAHWDQAHHLACLLIIDYINQILLLTVTQLLFIITALDQVST